MTALINPHAQADLERDRTPEVDIHDPACVEDASGRCIHPLHRHPICASCGDPLPPGAFKWCSRSCTEEDDGPYGPDDDELEDIEPEPEDEEPEED